MAEEQERRGELSRALDAYVKLRRAVSTLSALEADVFRQAGLTESQFGVLEALLHRGPLCQKELAVKILKSTANLTTVIDNLERRGLVTRQRDTADRRVVTVHLSEEGRELITAVFPRNADVLLEAFRVLSPQEQDQLAVLCRRLGRQQPR